MTSPGGSSRTVKIVISADVASAIRALGQTEQGLGSVAQGAEQAGKKTSTMGDVMKGTLAAAGIQAGLSGVVDGLKGVVSGGLEYERSMNTMGAVSGASASQMQAVADRAKQLGADIKIPGASAQTAAAAMTELAKGGLTAQESMDAARGTMILAAAAQIDGAQAAEIQANALNTFGLKADDAGRVANVLANVANKSSGEISDFAQGLAQAGTVASSFGWSIEDTTTYLGLMANAGIKGSDAGTSLKTTMTALLKPTKDQAAALEELGIQTRDSNGNMISAKDLATQLATAKGRMSDAEFNAAAATAFGTDAVRTALVAAQAGAVGYDEMATALGNVNGAQDVAAANSKGLTGIIEALQNTVDTAALSLFEELQPSIMQVAKAATELVGPLAEGLAPALGAVADLATGSLAPAIEGLAGFLGAVAGPLSDVIKWFSDLPGPVGGAVLAIGGVLALRGPLAAMWTSMGTTVTGLRTGITGFAASLRAASGAAATFGVVARGALGALGGPIGLAIVGVTTALAFMGSETDDVAESTSDFSEAIDENTGALNANAPAVIAKRLADQGQLTAAEKAGVAIGDYTRAVMQQGDALSQVQGQIRAAAVEQLKASGEWENFGLQARRAKMDTDEYLTSILASGDASRGAAGGLGDLIGVYSTVSSEANRLATQQTQVNQANSAAKDVASDAAGGIDKVGDAAGNAATQLDEAEEKASPFADALKELRGAASEADAATNYLIESLELLVDGSVSADQMQRSNAAAMRAVVASNRENAEATRRVAEANAQVAEKQAEYNEIAAHLGTTLDGQAVSATNLAITQADVDRASRELAAAQDAVKDAEDGVIDAQDRQSDSLIKLADNAREMAGKAYANKAAQGDMAGGIIDATKMVEEQRQKFIDTVLQINGGNIPAAEELADKYGLIPSDVVTQITQEGMGDALTALDKLKLAIQGLTNSPHIVKVAVESGEVVYTTSSGTKMMAGGGPVSGPGTGTSDSIPARLSDGEFVSTAATVQRPGNRAALDYMHAGGSMAALGFAGGGLVDTANILMRATAGDLVNTGWMQGVQDQAKKIAKGIWEQVGFGGSNGQWGPGTDGSGLAANTAAAREFIMRRWGISNIGGVYGGSVPGSDHPIGKALDVMIANWASAAGIAQGDSVANWFLQNPNAFGTKYLIWRKRYNDGSGWVPYSHPSGSNPTLDHFDHVHLSLKTGPGQFVLGGGVGDAPGGGVSALGQGVERWRPTVLQALARTGQPAGFADYVLNQMRTESSGNPQAINLTDSNARRGTPSKGLMQVIDPTFQSYRDPGLTNDIWLPISNITAAIRYVLARYGSIPAGMRGVAYENGGVLPPGFTMAYNGTGKNEHVFNAAQMAAAGSGSPRIEITNYVDIHGMLARTEVMVNGKMAQVERQISVALASSS